MFARRGRVLTCENLDEYVTEVCYPMKKEMKKSLDPHGTSWRILILPGILSAADNGFFRTEKEDTG